MELTEEINQLQCKIKAVESERDEYVKMIGENIQIIQKLNIQVGVVFLFLYYAFLRFFAYNLGVFVCIDRQTKKERILKDKRQER